MKQQKINQSPLLFDLLLIFFNIIPIMSAIITLTYLGPTFSDDVVIEPDDWRRKWLIFFGWLSLISIMMMIILILLSRKMK
jgi:hypothetical protein